MNPTQVWTYVEPGDDGKGVQVYMTEAQIIDEYYEYWSSLGVRDEPPTYDDCIDDWVSVHWAWKV